MTSRKPLDILLKFGALFIVLEPVWMLLPFAGFLYGSVMHIETLGRFSVTAPLVHFVFPVHTLFPLGLVLVLAGSVVFFAGALQIYSGKILKKGLITTGIYRKFRHPQYLALTLFGAGVIVTWGRLITFIAFFIMLWLYFHLARIEERKCRELFGAEYDKYRAGTFFLFPGEKPVAGIFRKIVPENLPGHLKPLVSFILVVILSATSGLLIIRVKENTRNSLQVISGIYHGKSSTHDVDIPLMMVKGPALQAAPSEARRSEFMQMAFKMLLSSQIISKELEKLLPDENHTILAFPTPGSNWYSGAHRDFRRTQLDFILFLVRSPVHFTGHNFKEFRKKWEISQMLQVKDMSYGRIEQGLDPAEGPVIRHPYEQRMEERVNFLLSGLKQID